MIEFAAITHRGLRRPHNEDAVGIVGQLLTGEMTDPVAGKIQEQCALFAVADGVGGLHHGGRASRELIVGLIAQDVPEPDLAACSEAVCRAALAVHAVTIHAPETVGMATTLAGIVLRANSACWFNVGDSRVYLLREGHLRQLSVDDATDGNSGGRQTSRITRSIGGRRALAPMIPHAGEVKLVAGDRLLLCSDGLWGPLSDSRTEAILRQHDIAEAAVRALLVEAFGAGGPDNISIVLLQ